MILPSVALPTLQEHDVQGEPDTLALKFQLFSWVWNTIFKHQNISKELKIIMTFHMTEISGSRLDVSL